MHRFGIRRGMHRDRADPHFPAGALDAQRDLAAVGDQDLLEQSRHSRIINGSPNSTGAPFEIRICDTVPALGALIWLNVFIASISSRVWPAATDCPTVTKLGAPGSGDR